MLTPARRRGVEFLDDPAFDAVIAERSLRDVARSNRLFGGSRAVTGELDVIFRQHREARPLVLLDVGTGLGDIPAAARARAARHGVSLTTIGVELTSDLARAARAGAQRTLAADARHLPFSTASVDIVTCSQVLHHFDDVDTVALLIEMSRIARHAVVVSDIRRSWLAAGLLWLASFPLAFHPVSRHDGVVSVLRGYTVPELSHTVRGAVGREASVRRRLGWRITASWSPR